jgi:hypothetical protein
MKKMKDLARLLSILLLLAAPAPAPAQAPAQAPAPAEADRVTVADLYGGAEKRVSAAPEQWVALSAGDLLPPDSAVRTGEHAGMLLVLPGKHAIRVGENTKLELKEVGRNNSYYFQLIEGEIWSFVNKARRPAKYEVETASTILGVSGTLFSLSFDRSTSESDMSVEDGVVSLRQGAAAQTVTRGFATRVQLNQLARARVLKQDRAIQQMWRLFHLRETWTRPGAALKISRELEADVRALRREHERQVQRQQERAKAKARKTPPKKPVKPAGGQL